MVALALSIFPVTPSPKDGIRVVIPRNLVSSWMEISRRKHSVFMCAASALLQHCCRQSCLVLVLISTSICGVLSKCCLICVLLPEDKGRTGLCVASWVLYQHRDGLSDSGQLWLCRSSLPFLWCWLGMKSSCGCGQAQQLGC